MKLIVKIGLLLSSCLLGLYLLFNARSLHEDLLISYVGEKSIKIVSPSNHNTGGTGFSVKGNTGRVYTLTNGHVCEVAENSTVHASIPDSERFYSLRVLDVSEETDLCLLEGMPGASGLNLGDENAVADEVMIIGHPALLPTSLARGRILSFERIKLVYKTNLPENKCKGKTYEWVSTEDTLLDVLFGINSLCFRNIESALMNAQVFPGNSGSPVVNFWGRVIGVVFAGDTRTNYGYMVPIKDVIKFMEIY